MTIAPFTLKSATTNANAPFSLGYTFKQGEVPVGTELVGPFADLQVVTKNVWPDGSLKFAIVSGRASLTSNVALSVQLSAGTPAAGAALTTADLKATSAVAEIGAGTFGTVSWATTDWDTPWKTWVSGPKMSSWLYRKQIGTDPHLVGWLEVRLFVGGAVAMDAWVENGYLKVAAPVNKNATYTFTLGGTQRFSAAYDLKHHGRLPLISGAILEHWLGTDPGVTPRLDRSYMQTTEMVPTYSVTRSATGLGLVSTFTPGQASNFTYDSDIMASGGYQPPIGLLPQHDVAYLVCNDQDELLYGAVVRNALSVGRYSIHYRDESTNRIPAFTTHATLVLQTGDSIKDTGASTASNRTPAPAGGYAASWDTAHCPSVGYMAYLLTGRWYHMETAQFAIAASWFNINNNFPDLATGIRFAPTPGAVQTRTVAWGSRLLFQALAITPDADTTVRAELVGLAERIVNYYHATYVAQANNQFGIIKPGETYTSQNGDLIGAMWQQDFFTATYGYALSLGLPLATSATEKLAEFFRWKARSAVGRLGVQGDFWYINASPYYFAMAPSTTSNYLTGAGPWFSSWNEMYEACKAHTTSTWFGSTEGTLYAVEGVGDYDAWAKGLPGNLIPAISYAVRHGVPGAVEAYGRLTSASNFAAFESAFSGRPVWGMEPASVGVVAGAGFTGPVIRVESTSMIPGMIVCGERGLGILGSAVPSTGTTGPSPVFNDLVFPEDAGKSVMWRITQWPATGVLTVYEDCSCTFAPAAAGTETFKYQLYIYGAPYGSPQTVTLSSGVTASAPNVPTVSLVPGDGQVVATVTPPTFNGGSPITSYRVILSNGQVVDGIGPTFTITVANGVAVFATATATNAIGTSPQSSASVTVTPSEVLTAPSAPTIGIATAIEGGISIAFTAPADDGGTPITSYIATTSSGETASGVASPIIIDGLSLDQERTVTVVAVNPIGTSPASAPSNAVIPAGPPAVLITMVGNITIDQVTHNLIAASCQPAESGFLGSLLYQYSINGGAEYIDLGTARNFIRGDLSPRTAYQVAMRARDNAGNVSAPLLLQINTLDEPLPVLPAATPPPSNATRSLEWLRDAAVRWSGNRTDLLPMMDDFIMLAETRIDTDLEARLQMTSTILRTTPNLSGVLLPFDLAEIRSLNIPGFGPVGYLDPDSFNSWTAREAVGQPRYFTVTGPYLYMTPVPDDVYDMVCSYRQTIPSLLDAADGVNWLIRDQPNIYLAAVMVEVINFTKNYEEMAAWESKYQTAIGTMNQQDWHVGGSLTMRAC